jgi:hypothetical protein
MLKLLASLHPVIEAFLISFFENRMSRSIRIQAHRRLLSWDGAGNRRQATFADGDKQDPVKSVKIC